MTEQQQRRPRSGSFMSDRQIANAALQQRLITFRFLSSQVPHEVRGYVVGMDDYKWLLATRSVDGTSVITALVHKSVDLVLLGAPDSLSREPTALREEVTAMGQSFWDWCGRIYAGRSGGL